MAMTSVCYKSACYKMMKVRTLLVVNRETMNLFRDTHGFMKRPTAAACIITDAFQCKTPTCYL